MALKSNLSVTLQAESDPGNMRARAISIENCEYPLGPVNLQAAHFDSQYVFYQWQLPVFKTSFFHTQYAIRAPEVFVSDLIYPELIGLAWETGMKPVFSTKVAQHTSGRETRTAFWEDPRWDFNLNYDYLPNREVGTTDLKKLLGFFLKCQGSYETFLFKAPDFHTVVNQQLLVGDGDINEVTLIQDIDGYTMPIGYIDSNSLVLRQTQTMNQVADGSAELTLTFPYQAVITLVMQGATPITPTSGAPGVNQYRLNFSTGEMEFNAARAGQTFAITYTAQLRETIEFDILYPRTVVLETATPDGGTLSGSYEYYFTCRFPDEMDFSQFSDKLWNLQEVEFRSTIE